MHAVGIVECEDRDLIRVRGGDPASHLAEVRRLVEDAVTGDECSLRGEAALPADPVSVGSSRASPADIAQ